jgi:hypothetical protein
MAKPEGEITISVNIEGVESAIASLNEVRDMVGQLRSEIRAVSAEANTAIAEVAKMRAAVAAARDVPGGASE